MKYYVRKRERGGQKEGEVLEKEKEKDKRRCL